MVIFLEILFGMNTDYVSNIYCNNHFELGSDKHRPVSLWEISALLECCSESEPELTVV